jgi:hypothetical protein
MWKLGLRPRKYLFWEYINPNFFAVLINPLLSGIIAARDEESDINFAEKMTQTDLFLPNFLLVSHALTDDIVTHESVTHDFVTLADFMSCQLSLSWYFLYEFQSLRRHIPGAH